MDILILLLLILWLFSGEEQESKELKDKILFHYEEKGSTQYLPKIKDCGFNIIQSYNALWWSDEVVENFLNECNKLGLKWIPSVANCFSGNEFSKEDVKNFINKWKSHPAVHSWYILDEPMLKKISKKEQEEAYSFVKEIDHSHPISVAYSGTYDENRYDTYFTDKAFDVAFLDCYPYSKWATKEPLQIIVDIVNIWKKKTKVEAIPLIQTFYDDDLIEYQKPNGYIKDEYDTFAKAGIKGNIACYCWKCNKGKGIGSDYELYNETLDFLDGKGEPLLPPIPTSEFIEIGKTDDWWFWSLQEFEEKLYTGTYQMQGPKIYSYPPWEHLITFKGGESVLGLLPFKENLYAISEDMGDNGKIYRMDNPNKWTIVHIEKGWYPKPYAYFGFYCYVAWTRAGGDIKILRSANGIDWEETKTWKNKGMVSFVIFKRELYILGWQESNKKSWISKTSDGVNWEDVSVLCNHNFGQSHRKIHKALKFHYPFSSFDQIKNTFHHLTYSNYVPRLFLPLPKLLKIYFCYIYK